MKKIMLIAFIGTVFTTAGCAQDSKETEIKKTIETFSKAGDKNDVKLLNTVLDNNFRIVMNRLFGSKEVSIMDKSAYIGKIKSKEYGGDKRELTISNILINGNTASAKVEFKGTKMTFYSLITLVQGTDDEWKLIQDVPIIK